MEVVIVPRNAIKKIKLPQRFALLLVVCFYFVYSIIIISVSVRGVNSVSSKWVFEINKILLLNINLALA